MNTDQRLNQSKAIIKAQSNVIDGLHGKVTILYTSTVLLFVINILILIAIILVK